ncbi:APC family permease [Stygiolobus caldivivus]|uniref:Amino acid permease n=1 Tax=Stygiolobus caldivivus TaxID=2824673 RepID=A0A8D5ZIF1_9CREN|nr:APC family permease [Stygiolobus caldivivus]BCU69556.1 amino acid permease [Stygiolobus caldivivus]
MDSLSKRLEPKEETIRPELVYAQSLSSIAPLGSVSAYLTYALSSSLASTFLAGLLGALIYFLWVLIGYRYSKVVATTGGTYDFARSGGGELLGKISGWLYWMSYTLYLSSASTYLAGVVITSEFNVDPSFFELLIPIVLTILLLTGIRPPLYYAFITSTLEIIFILLLGIKVLTVTGLSIKPLLPSVSPSALFSGSLAVGFTLAGGGASFFLGYEAKGRGKTVGKAYIIAYCVAAIAVIFASYFEIASVGYSNSGIHNLLNVTQYPGFYIAEKFMGNTYALIFLLLTVNSLIGSVTAAYVALSRLTYSLIRKDMLLSILILATVFISINVLAAVTNSYLTVYTVTTEMSLVTLYASHTIVSSVYPFFTKKIQGRSTISDLILSVSATILMGYGIFSNLVPVSQVSVYGIISLIAGVIIGSIHWWLKR